MLAASHKFTAFGGEIETKLWSTSIFSVAVVVAYVCYNVSVGFLLL